MTIALVIGLLPSAAILAAAADVVEYIYYTYDDTSGLVQHEGSTSDYTEVTSGGGTDTWETGWYVVRGEVTYTGSLTVSGEVNLILADGCKLTAAGVYVSAGNTLNIYAQSEGEAMGSLESKTSIMSVDSGIGGSSGVDNGSFGAINIHGGRITASGRGAGIGGGGGNKANSGSIAIYGGNINATGTGAGIGGGTDDSGTGSGQERLTIAIHGGTISATGGASNFNSSAGIGSGYAKSYRPVVTITITGGSITAKGGQYAPGIGDATISDLKTGGDTEKSTITISGGTVHATRGNTGAADIGAGNGCETAGDLTVEDGAVIYIPGDVDSCITNTDSIDQ